MKYITLSLLLAVAITAQGQTIPPSDRNCFDYSKDTSKQQVKGMTYPYTTTFKNEGDVTIDTPKIWREVDRNHVYTIREDKAGNIRAFGRNRGDGQGLAIGRGNFDALYDLYLETLARCSALEKRIDSLEHHPYLFIDTKGVRPGIYLTNAAGEYQIFITSIK